MEQNANAEQSQATIRERFLRAYSNLPLNAREEIIAVLEDGPVTWKVAYFEVVNSTPRGNEILEKIEKINIL